MVKRNSVPGIWGLCSSEYVDGRRATRGMIAGLLLAFEQRDASVLRELIGNGCSGDPAADNNYIVVRYFLIFLAVCIKA